MSKAGNIVSWRKILKVLKYRGPTRVSDPKLIPRSNGSQKGGESSFDWSYVCFVL